MQFKFQYRWLWITLCTVAIVATAIGGGMSWANQKLIAAQRAFGVGDWKQARDAVSIYLWLHPNHARAHLLMAEALICDDNLQGESKVYEALRHLKKISDHSDASADARLMEGRLYLLFLLQPSKAEECFKQSLRDAPNRIETHTLLWKTYNLVDQWDLAEEHVWKIYEQTPPPFQMSLLRDWYLSEFCSIAVNAELDRFLGFLHEGEQISSETDRRRFQAFIDANPDSPEFYAIFARWYFRKRQDRLALELLEKAEKLPDASKNSLLIALRIAINLEMGELDQVGKMLDRWPSPKEGYEYWKTAGLVAHEVHGDEKLACEEFERALVTTPGKSDWRTMHRLAQSLTRRGETEKSAVILQQSRQVSALMDPEFHRRLRLSFVNPQDPRTAEQMVDFYSQLGRLREVAAWQRFTPSGSAKSQAGVDIPR